MLRVRSIASLTVLFLAGCPVSTTSPDAGPRLDAPFVRPDGPLGDGTSCVVGFTDCGGTCVRTASDDRNCGSCGNVCDPGVTCAAGVCDCVAPRRACDGVCLDVTRDDRNCGACGTACASTEMCVRGRCAPSCDGPGRLTCFRDEGGMMVPFCADLATDEENCGRCGTVCTGGSSCVGGACMCPIDQTFCDGTCTDLDVDPDNCGSCGMSCGPSGTCAGGRCTGCTDSAYDLCGAPASCVDVMTTPAHCGMCDRPCAGASLCNGGRCECTAPRTDCGAGCVNPLTDVRNCGGCGNDCGVGGACSAGVCTCATGYTMCGGECARLDRDREHCGTCDVSCVTGETCRMGTCVLADSFRITSLATTGCRATEHESLSGDDHGGVGLTTSRFFYTGDSSTVSFSASDGSGLSIVSGLPSRMHDAMITDIESETVYVLMAGATEISGGIGTVTALAPIDPVTGALSATRITLSTPITLGYGTAMMGGYAELLIGTPVGGNLQWYRIEVATGTVTTMGSTTTPSHAYCETWAFWGIEEIVSDVRYAVFVESSTRIVRMAIPDSGFTSPVASTVATFTNLSDMCSITFSTSRDRWYWHHEYNSEFAMVGFGEYMGYCDATWDRP